MKAVSIVLISLWGTLAPAQNSLLINELQASNQRTIAAPDGSTPDWIEIYNPTRRTIDLAGMRFSTAGDLHIIDAPIKVHPREHLILWCSGKPGLGADHLGFTLPRDGGSILLIAADGTTILDVFTWPQLLADESIGRWPDGARNWRFFSAPSPGASNDKMPGTTVRTPAVTAGTAPGRYTAPITLEFSSGANKIHYTTDGSIPDPIKSARYNAPITIDANTSIRARAFSPEGVPGPEFAGTYLIGEDPAIALIIDGPEIWDTLRGIGGEGPTANYSRTGREWERPAWFQMPGDSAALPVGIRISGSGSRSLAKRSFKVYARDRYDTPADAFEFEDGVVFTEGIIRADASPNAFLRNMLMESIVKRSDLDLAVQPSRPLPLFINANYHGLYRWMPPKDAQWIRHITGAESVDVIDGPGFEAITGSSDHFQKGLDHLLNGSSIDSVEAYFDLESLIDLACIDLFTGRADHDLNVRAYRPRQEGGKWKWVLFDMDLWAPVNDNSLERMSTSTSVETPFIPQIMARPELQHRLLARMAALNAGDLSPRKTLPIADSLHAAHLPELERDHQRWSGELQRPSPSEAITEMRGFLGKRGELVMQHLAARTGHPLKTVNIEVPDPALARMTINGTLLTPGKQRITLFSGIPMEVELLLNEGVRLISWTGHNERSERLTIDPGKVRQLKPRLSR